MQRSRKGRSRKAKKERQQRQQQQQKQGQQQEQPQEQQYQEEREQEKKYQEEEEEEMEEVVEEVEELGEEEEVIPRNESMEMTDEWDRRSNRREAASSSSSSSLSSSSTSQKIIEELKISLESSRHEHAQLVYKNDELEATNGALRDRNEYLEMEMGSLEQLVTQGKEKEKDLMDEIEALRARLQMYESAYEDMDAHSHHGQGSSGHDDHGHEREYSKDEEHTMETASFVPAVDKDALLWKQKYDELIATHEELANENAQLKEEQTRNNERMFGLQEEYLKLMDQVKYYENIHHENEELHEQIEKLRRKSIEAPQSMRTLNYMPTEAGEEDTNIRKLRSKTITNDEPDLAKHRTLFSSDNWFPNESIELMTTDDNLESARSTTIMLAPDDEAGKIMNELDLIWTKMFEYLDVLKDNLNEKVTQPQEEEEEEDIHTLANEVGQIASAGCLHFLIKSIDSAKLNAEKLYERCQQLQKEKESTQEWYQAKMKKLCQEMMTHHYKKYGHVKEIWRECASKTVVHFWKTYSPFPNWF